MSIINSIQSFLPRPENRSRQQIERDLEDEFDFHLEMKARNLMSQAPGLERDEAKDAARKMFGDVEAVKKQCQRIALRERIMLQRVNLVLMIVVMLVVIAVGAQVYITQRYNTLALQAITADLAKMKFDAEGAARTSAMNQPSRGGLVYLKGDVPRSGIYSLPEAGTLTISRMLTAAGADQDDLGDARVSIKRRDGNDWRMFNYAMNDAGIADFVLQNDDEVSVSLPLFSSSSVESGISAQSLPIGRWVQIDARAKPMPDGASMELIAVDDVRNLKGVPIGILTLPDGTEQYRVSFREGVAANLDIERVSDQVHLKAGRWEAQDGSVNVNITPAVAQTTNPLRFVFEGAGGATNADARTQAVGDFVVRLFALADPNDPNLNQTIRDFLDAEEKGLDQKYAGDPATAGMIRELIGARRKIFEADANALRADTAEQKAQAVSDFLQDVLTSADMRATSISVSGVLDNASKRLELQFADNPELKAQISERIAEATRNLQVQPADANPPASSPAREEEPQDSDPSRLSLFEEVRWRQQWTPIVRIQEQWYELVSVDGIAAQAIVDQARKQHGDQRAREHFSEDIDQMLIEMKQEPGTTSRIQVRDLRSGSVLAINESPWSAENRQMILRANRAAEDAGRDYVEWVDGD